MSASGAAHAARRTMPSSGSAPALTAASASLRASASALANSRSPAAWHRRSASAASSGPTRFSRVAAPEDVPQDDVREQTRRALGVDAESADDGAENDRDVETGAPRAKNDGFRG
jgi:hypothetical protein